MTYKNENFFMYSLNLKYFGNVYYIKKNEQVKSIAVIGKTENKKVKIDLWEEKDGKRSFISVYTEIKVNSNELFKSSKKLFDNITENREENLKKCLELFPNSQIRKAGII